MGDIDIWSWQVLDIFTRLYLAWYVIWAAVDRITGKTFNKGYQAGVRSRDTPNAVSRMSTITSPPSDDPTRVVWSVAVCSECGALKETE